MDKITDLNADTKEQFQDEDTDDFFARYFTETIQPTTDADGSCATECVSGDWFGEASEVDLADLKQEPDVVCCILYPVCILSQ